MLVLHSPLVVDELLEVQVGEGGGCIGPGPNPSTAVRVAASQCVRAHQGDNLLIIEAHAIEHITHM